MNKKHNEYIIERNERTTLEDLYSDETIFSLANGSLGTRGHFAEGYGTDDHPITLLNGFYNKYPLRYEENYTGFPQMGQTIVTLPDASRIQIIAGKEKIDLTHSKLVSLKRQLNMRAGYTKREATYETKKGFIFELVEYKLIAANRNEIILKLEVTSPNYEGPLKIKSYLSMPLLKYVKHDDPRLPDTRKHLELTDLDVVGQIAYLKARTTVSNQKIHVSMTHDTDFSLEFEHEKIVGYKDIHLKKNKTFSITKYALYTTPYVQKKYHQKVEVINDFIYPFEKYVEEEKTNRKTFWANSPIYLSDKEIETALRYNVYQLHLNAGKHQYTHIAAKGITGEGYEGHYFWDTEVYEMPYFILTNPNKARKILMYRYLTLNQSRREARNLGINRGAKIAWRTIDGMESSAFFLAGSAQIHINSDVTMAFKYYFDATKDLDFMIKYGAEVVLETALFLFDYGFFDEQSNFHIYQVTGPDEYTVLVDDNYYTNYMAKKHFEFAYHFATKYADELIDVFRKMNINFHTLEAFLRAANHMTLLIDDQRQIIKQDNSFLDKKDYDLSRIPRAHFPLLLTYHPMDLYRHQILKQADGILALVTDDYKDIDVYRNSFNYYLQRTTHDSSLSRCVYSIAAYRLGYEDIAFDYFKKVCDLDFRDSHNRTQHGLHIANLGGSYLTMIYGIFGFRFREVLTLNPVMQETLSKVKTKIKYHQTDVWLTLTNEKILIKTNKQINMMIKEKMYHVDKELIVKL